MRIIPKVAARVAVPRNFSRINERGSIKRTSAAEARGERRSARFLWCRCGNRANPALSEFRTSKGKLEHGCWPEVQDSRPKAGQPHSPGRGCGLLKPGIRRPRIFGSCPVLAAELARAHQAWASSRLQVWVRGHSRPPRWWLFLFPPSLFLRERALVPSQVASAPYVVPPAAPRLGRFLRQSPGAHAWLHLHAPALSAPSRPSAPAP